ncbi:MAG: S-methyl-5-thioribose-1-phosphate isomerase [candidate division Zixibacteria bacterium RBG_16_53_22]|nr:MAG: S-methyl-5-thioribose-1-phosphate isomerase [candidate division Zixibacteria bacterium RBG_16_53_22]
MRWADDTLIALNQRALPLKEEYLSLKSVDEVVEAIGVLTVRGAPLIGIAAAYGLCLTTNLGDDALFADSCRRFIDIRPTAVNLRWAVERMAGFRTRNLRCDNLRELMIEEARRTHAEDAEMCVRIGESGNSIVPEHCRILTHCNAGALATGGIGTALGIIYTAHFSGKRVEVWVDETRPVLQGARLTAWELSKAGVPYKLISDSMVGHLMAQGRIDLVITGADRVAANLDYANKIGTYSLAVLAKYHGIPFYAAAPSSTFDPACPNGKSIVIEQRPENEIRYVGQSQVAPSDAPVYNPAFDVTPHELVTGIITEKGILRP